MGLREAGQALVSRAPVPSSSPDVEQAPRLALESSNAGIVPAGDKGSALTAPRELTGPWLISSTKRLGPLRWVRRYPVILLVSRETRRTRQASTLHS
jgi:hypothetical protein